MLQWKKYEYLDAMIS